MGRIALSLITLGLWSLSPSDGFVGQTTFSGTIGRRLQHARLQSLSVSAVPYQGSRSSGTIMSAVVPLKAPPDMYQNAVDIGEKKAAASGAKILTMGVISGCHIAFGALLALSIGANCPELASSNPGLQKILFGAIGLPFGLFMTVVGGGELFTGNTAMVTAAAIEGKATAGGLMKNWILSYTGNFVGSLLMVFLAATGGIMSNPGAAIGIASAKTSLSFLQAFTRGVLANWLVCMAVWMSAGANDAAGKFFAILLPISAFVALGLDHSVANMGQSGEMAKNVALVSAGFLLGSKLFSTLNTGVEEKSLRKRVHYFTYISNSVGSVGSVGCMTPVVLLYFMGSSRFLIPMGMTLGAGITWSKFLLANLLPVTLGNIVGGVVAVCGLYSGAFGSLFKKKA